jgi:hypothetical protein
MGWMCWWCGRSCSDGEEPLWNAKIIVTQAEDKVLKKAMAAEDYSFALDCMSKNSIPLCPECKKSEMALAARALLYKGIVR